MLNIPSPGTFENIGQLISAQQSSEHVKPCGQSMSNHVVQTG